MTVHCSKHKTTAKNNSVTVLPTSSAQPAPVQLPTSSLRPAKSAFASMEDRPPKIAALKLVTVTPGKSAFSSSATLSPKLAETKSFSATSNFSFSRPAGKNFAKTAAVQAALPRPFAHDSTASTSSVKVRQNERGSAFSKPAATVSSKDSAKRAVKGGESQGSAGASNTLQTNRRFGEGGVELGRE